MFNWKAENQILLDEQVGGKGRHFSTRFLQPGLVKYSFGVCLLEKQVIDRFIQGFVGCPVIINHKDVTSDSAKNDRVGVISRVWFDDYDGWYWGEGVIFEQEALDLIDQGYNVSCQYEITEYSSTGGLHNGNDYDKTILNGKPEHLAIVKNPRYENAMIAVNAMELETAKNDDGYWFSTEEGVHIHVNKGESKKEALEKRFGNKVSDAKTKTKEKENAQEMSRDQLQKWQDKKGVTAKQRDAIADYTGDLYMQVGEYLRGDLDGDKYSDAFVDKIKNIVKNIDSAMSPLPQCTQLYNVTDKSTLKKIINNFALDDSIIGEKFSNKSFTSTSYTKDNVFYETIKKQGASSPSVLLNIKAAKGVEAVFAEPYTLDQDEEREVILNRDLVYKITKVTQDDRGFYVIDCDVEHSAKNSIIQTISELKDDNMQATNEEGHWITIKGTHVFVKEGQSIEDAMKEIFDKTSDDKQSDLQGKYEREDVEFDEEQLKKDIKAAKDMGHESVEDIAEFLGLDEDEVRETMASEEALKLDKNNKAKNSIIQAINEIKETDMFKNLFKKKEKQMDKEEMKSLMMECLTELSASNAMEDKKEEDKKEEPDYKKLYNELKAKMEAGNKCKNEDEEKEMEDKEEDIKAKNSISQQKEMLLPSGTDVAKSRYVTRDQAIELGNELFG